MSIDGTSAYADGTGLPPLVDRALALARSAGFEQSCIPEQGRLLQLLAAGVPSGGAIGETGTGCGVGLAWLASGARPGTRITSVEADPERAAASAELYAGTDSVVVIHGDWTELQGHGPFDLLALDGGGQGKSGGSVVDPPRWLTPGGTVVIDDLTPMTTWPPTFQGRIDEARMVWLDRSDMIATELVLRPDSSTLVGVWHGGLPPGPAT